MSMSVDGLVSGMDTTNLIAQLLQAEAAPQTQLKVKLAAAQTEASGYRTVNNAFAAVRAAAEALSANNLSAARKVSSSVATVTASAGTTAIDGSALTFTVTGLASRQTVISNTQWGSLTGDARTDKDGDPAEPAWPLEIRKADGTTKTVTIAADATLADAVKAINDAKAGVQASAVKVADGTYRLQVTGSATGTANAFELKSATETDADGNVGSAFTRTSTAANAVIDLGAGITAESSTNTFADLLGGVSVTVSKLESDPVTVAVSQDAEGVATKMQALVDSVNTAMNTVRTYTSNAPGSTATLKGDFNLTSLNGLLQQAVYAAVGDESPSLVGLQLTKDGKNIAFDKGKFTTALKETPELAQRIVAGRAAGPGVDGISGNNDDVTALTGVAARLLQVAKNASDSTTGSIVALAKGKDTIAADIKNRIEAWDTRLARRKETLTRQFTAMETALSSLRNQSTWLAGQINSLPSYG